MSSTAYNKSYGDHPGLESGLIYSPNQSTSNARSWWDSFSKGVIGISTFGASISFSVIVTDLPDPVAIRAASTSSLAAKITFEKETVRKFLSLAWLMFLLALGFALISQLKLRKSDGTGGSLKFLGLILNGLILSAFMFLSLSVAAYVPEVGMAGVGFLSWFGLMILGMWFNGET
jgi:hypothetical protein